MGQLGQVRAIGASSYNGFRHMNAQELRALLARGWGVGNHSWSHTAVNAATADLELGRAKCVLEEAVGEPVTVYCSPNCNDNMNAGALEGCRRYGYLGAMSLTDALNRPDDEDLLWLNRTFLHTQGYGPFYSEFDPFRNILHARHDAGWIIDYLHCPLQKPLHPNKDCSADELRQRIEAIVAEGGGDVWLARIEDAMDYRYTHRHAKITHAGPNRFRIETFDLPAGVRRRTVTLALASMVRGVDVNGRSAAVKRSGDQLLVDVDLSRPQTLVVHPLREVVTP